MATQGNDIIFGTQGNDTNLNGLGGNDTIYGLGGNDIINGGTGNDIIDGGTGIDNMNGGDNNDTYFVDNIGDIAAESFNDALGGIDTVNSSVTHTLGFGIENLNLTGSAAINGTGNSNNNTINGNSAANIINGGAGADKMNGRDGNDTYFVDNIGDIAAESFNDAFGGIDTVNSSVTHTLGFGIENLNLTGSAAVNGTGNSNNNTINGNSAANTIKGGGGADTLNGANGNDTILGEDGNDIILGGPGQDTLNGGAGKDILSGNAGSDKFVFDLRDTANADSILDFSHQDDTIVLANNLDTGILGGAINPGIKGLVFVDSNNVSGNIPGNTLSPNWYFEGPGWDGDNPLQSGESGLSGIYVNTTNGEIWYNPTDNDLNDIYAPSDAELIGKVDASVAASLDHTDFVYGA